MRVGPIGKQLATITNFSDYFYFQISHNPICCFLTLKHKLFQFVGSQVWIYFVFIEGM